MKKIKLGLGGDSVIGRNGVLGVPQKKKYPEAPMGGGGLVASFIVI